MAAEEHDHDEHDHGTLAYKGTTVAKEVLDQLRPIHPALVENLELCARFGSLTEEERKHIPTKQREVEHFTGWTPGFHAAGDKCATCGKPTTALFTDQLEQGDIAYAAFLYNLPVHATAACVAGLPASRRDVSPRGVDRARRELTRDLERPSTSMAMFFRHDLLAHPPFGLEDWAISVVEANPGGLDKGTLRDIDRLIRWMHQRLFHH